MKGDFSRFTFDPKKHYTGVRMQQGRVQLDADWNEQVDLQLNRERRELRDIIGYAGGPRDNLGFKITANGNKLKVGKGHYYVAGRLCWNDHEFNIGNIEAIREGTYLAYLDVWERHVTWLEDADIREAALGGPDTATRTHLVSQVKLMPVDPDVDCSAYAVEDWVPDQHMSTGKMRAQSKPVPNPPDDICAPTQQSGYTGLENQLYRVEIHQIDGNKVTFKWSRENGCVATRWTAISGNSLTVMSTGLDDKLGFKPGDLVELTNTAYEKAGHPGILAELKSVGDDTLEINSTVNLAGDGTVRRWEGQGEFSAGGTGNTWIQLEDGISIAFEGGTFQPGDYWTIPARAFLGKGSAGGQGDILWPLDDNELPVFEKPHGPEHVYCPLAICTYTSNYWRTTPCQQEFTPLIDRPAGSGSCCTVYIRPGDDIQKAIDSLDRRISNVICLLPGTHLVNKTIKTGGPKLTIIGCGSQTEIDARGVGGLAFDIILGRQLCLEKLTVRTAGNEGSLRISGGGIEVQEVTVLHNDADEPSGPIPVLSLYSYADCVISRCSFLLNAKNKGWISLMGKGIAFSQNQLQEIGIMVWGPSLGIKLTENHINKNKDAGILLGGSTSIGPPKHTDEHDNAGMESMEIANNSIENTAKSAILVSTELYKKVAAAASLRFIKISNNYIFKCCLSNELEPIENKDIAQAGIFLRDAQSILIDSNQIVQCGDSRVPACGIFLYHCEGVQISGNILNDNGCGPTDLNQFKKVTERSPYQGGIVALMLFDAGLSEMQTAPLSKFDPGRRGLNLPAASISDNQILSPAGQALFLVGYGVMTIQNNVFKTTGIGNQPYLEASENLGTGIFIANQYYTMPISHVVTSSSEQIQCHTQFHDNHVHFTAVSQKIPGMIVPVLLFSNHLSVHGNQIRSRLHDDQNAINLQANGDWVSVIGNLVMREPGGSQSLKEATGVAVNSTATWNTTVNNQANECIVAVGENVVKSPNQHPKTCDMVLGRITNIR